VYKEFFVRLANMADPLSMTRTHVRFSSKIPFGWDNAAPQEEGRRSTKATIPPSNYFIP
jgi:hypothetical protein